MNIPKYIQQKGYRYLAETYGLSIGSLHTWKDKSDDWQPSALIRLAFLEIRSREEAYTELYSSRASALESMIMRQIGEEMEKKFYNQGFQDGASAAADAITADPHKAF